MAGGTGNRVSRVSDFYKISRILTMMLRRPLLLVFAALFACSNDEDVAFTLPPLSTPYALFATAAAGRPLRPSAVQRFDVNDLPAGLRPETISGGDIDVVWAGLDDADMPAGLTVEDLVFVRSDTDGTRPLPPIYEAHVLRAPSPPEAPDPLVPLLDNDVSSSVRADRENRLDTMLSDLAIADPCVDPAVPWQINTPRISSEAVARARVMSDGSTILGLSTTSTAVMGSIAANSLDVVLIGVGTGEDVVPPLSRAAVIALDGAEVTHRSGRLVPSRVSLTVQSGLGAGASVWLWDNSTWREDIALIAAEDQPRSIQGLRQLNVDGVPSLCAYGVSLSSQRPATLWCRPVDGETWSTIGLFDARFGFSTVAELSDGRLIAADYSGTVYARSSAGWSTIFESVLNVGCDLPCVTIRHAVHQDTSDARLIWLAGDKMALLRVRIDGNDVTADAPSGLDAALFADERATASLPANIADATLSPDGALWMATDRGLLLRRDPAGSVQRICLPPALKGVDIGAIVTHADGRLLVAGSPVILAQSRW